MPGLFDQVKEGVLGIFGGGGEAMTQAGAAALISSGRGDPGLAPLGYAAQTGMQVRMMLEEKARQDRNRAELAQLISDVGMSPTGLQQVFLEALGNGQIEEAKAIAEILKSLGAQSQPRNLNFTNVDRAMPDGTVHTFRAAFDPFSGQLLNEVDLGEAPPNTMFERTETLNIDGRPVSVGIVRGTGERVIIGEAWEGGSGGGAAVDRTNRALSDVMLEAHETLNQNDMLLAAPVQGSLARMGQGGGPVGLFARMATDPQTQVAFSAALQFLNPTVRFLSGAQMTEPEARRYQAALIPMPGDNEATVARKRRARQVLVEAIRNSQGMNSRAEAFEWLSAQGLQMPTSRVADEFIRYSSEVVPMPAFWQSNDAGMFSHLLPGN